jgi:hypothetical protein
VEQLSPETSYHRKRSRWTARKKISLRNTCCAVCDSTDDLERHHDDHDKPLEVTILCRPCHAHHHRVVLGEGWGRPAPAIVTCRQCGIDYRPKESRFSTYCSRSCATAGLHAINARRRADADSRSA